MRPLAGVTAATAACVDRMNKRITSSTILRMMSKAGLAYEEVVAVEAEEHTLVIAHDLIERFELLSSISACQGERFATPVIIDGPDQGPDASSNLPVVLPSRVHRQILHVGVEGARLGTRKCIVKKYLRLNKQFEPNH